MRALRGRRLDDDLVELPVMPLMREFLVRGPRLDDDAEAFVKSASASSIGTRNPANSL
jgi:hypothetical protein